MEISENDLPHSTAIDFQAQTNQNPFSQPQKLPQIQQNILTEKVDSNNENNIDPNSRINSLEQKLQLKTQDQILKAGPLKDLDLNFERSGRYSDTESPKPVNAIFGGLNDFVNFFSKRNPRILDFVQLFEFIEDSEDVEALNKNICPELEDCILKEFMKQTPEKPKDKIPSKIQKNIEIKGRNHKEELISLFRKDFSDFEEFYENVLRGYTLNTFLYQNLNKYLREENWKEIHDLLPYAFCLCKIFFSITLDLNDEILENLSEDVITLYRGTALTEKALQYFDPKKVRNFSWYAVTSTTRKEGVARKFMEELDSQKEKKHPVLFVITVPITGFVDYQKFLNVDRCSIFPKEEEVLLPPGSVFELQEVTKDENEVIIIKLKLMNDIKSLAYEGLIMQGAMQSEMITNQEAKIMCLEGDDLCGALKSLSSNTLIEQVEFCLCSFDNKSLGKTMEILPTLENIKGLKFISCSYKNEGEIPSIIFPQDLSVYMEINEMNNFYRILSFNKKFWISCLQSLNIDFSVSRKCDNEGLYDFSSKGLQNLPQLTSLHINLSHCSQITDEGIYHLCQGLRFLTNLTDLDLNISWCFKLSDQSLVALASNLTKLTCLNLNLMMCQITNEGLKILLSEGANCKSLEHFDLNLRGCHQITSETVKELSSQYLTRIKSLQIYPFIQTQSGPKNQKHPHEPPKILFCARNPERPPPRPYNQSLTVILGSHCHARIFPTTASSSNLLHWIDSLSRNKPSLIPDNFGQPTILDLDFTQSKEVTDKFIENLCNQAIKHLSQLTTLAFNFSGCEQITDEGVHCLCSQGLKYLPQLKSLTITISSLLGITDKSLNSLGSCGLENLTELTSLSLSFFKSAKVTDQGVDFLCSQGLKHLTQLTSLTFNFSWCKLLTDDSIYILCSQALKHLTQITTLTLIFLGCEQLTNQGVSNLALQGLQNLSSLTSIDLSFSQCEKITDKGVNSLWSHGIKPLDKLTFLSVNFSTCPKITNEAISDLDMKSLKSFTKLTYFSLNFSQCPNITDEGLNNFCCKTLRNMPQLTRLVLSFCACKLTNKGINSLLVHGLKYLKRLKVLHLDFSSSQDITDEGVNNLCYQTIKHLGNLESVCLKFKDCNQITGFTFSNITRVMRYFGFK